MIKKKFDKISGSTCIFKFPEANYIIASMLRKESSRYQAYSF